MDNNDLKLQKSKQFVVYPHPANNEPQPDLDPKDKLVYVAIRRYMNKNTMEAYPSYAKITEDIGAAAVTIKKCVDHLVEQGYLETYKKGRSIYYKFNNKKFFEPYSFDFLDKKDLTFTEKSYIVATQQYMIKNSDSDEGKVSYTNKELSELIQMPQSTISRVNHSLQNKGYLEGASELTKRFQLRKLDQLFIWKFKQQDERITKMENTLYKVIEDNKVIKKENEIIKQEIEKLKNPNKIKSCIITL